MRSSSYVPYTVEEHEKYVTSSKARTYHWVRREATCMNDWELGRVQYYRSRCGQRYMPELVERHLPIPKGAQECSRCMDHRVRSEHYEITRAERELLQPKALRARVSSLFEALQVIPEVVGRVERFSIEWNEGKPGDTPPGYEVSLLYLTKEQVELKEDRRRGIKIA